MSRQKQGPVERRSAGRIETDGKLPGELALDLETDVLQISEGGMMVEVPMPLEIGSRHGFTLSLDADVLDLSGLVRNCQPFPPSGPPEAYRIGIEFMDVQEHQRECLAGFVSKKLGN